MRRTIAAALVAAVVSVSASPMQVSARTIRSGYSAFSTMSVDEALAQSRATGRPLVIMFSAKWCGPCKSMEQSTWTDEAVLSAFRQGAIAVHVDVDEEREVAARYNAQSLPLLVGIRNGQVVERSVGFKDPERLIGWVRGLPGAGTAVAQDAQRASTQNGSQLVTQTAVVSAGGAGAAAGGQGGQVFTTRAKVVAAQTVAAEPVAAEPVATEPGSARQDAPVQKRVKKAAAATTDRPTALVRREFAKLSKTLEEQKGKTEAQNAARRSFRAEVGKRYAGLLQDGREAEAGQVLKTALELDNTAWMRLALVQQAAAAGEVRGGHGKLLDEAAAKGADVKKARAMVARGVAKP